MKTEYRKKNSYTPDDVIDNLSQHQDVKVLRARVFHFHNWDSFFDKYMHRTQLIKKNHVFTCNALDHSNLHVQEYWGAPITKQRIVKTSVVNTDWSNRANKPEMLQYPGMKDIKYKELYDKWRPLVPVAKRKEYKCYDIDPGESIRGKVKANTKAAKAALTGRTASNVVDIKAVTQQSKSDANPPTTKGII